MKRIYTLLAILLSAACVWAIDVSPNETTTISTEGTYTLIATSEDPTEFTLTTDGKTIKANLVIRTNIGGTTAKQGDVIVTLDNFRIQGDAPIHVYGKGAVTFKVTASSRIISLAKQGGIGINAGINAPDTHVRFQIDDGAYLRVCTTYDEDTNHDTNILPIFAKEVSLEKGKLECWALTNGKYNPKETYPLTPIIEAETINISGETTQLLPTFIVALANFNAAAYTSQKSPLKYTTLNYTGGTTANTDKIQYPESGILTVGNRYNYPTLSYNKLIADAKGGTILDTVIEPKLKTFSFPGTSDFSESAAAYVACFKSATTGVNPAADAITIDAEKKTVTIDTTKCPDPEIVYAKDGTAGAIDLFGASAFPTANGIDISYNFGIDWIGVADGTIQMTAAVDLLNETADTKQFHITVTTEDGEAIFEKNLTFTRIEDSNRFRSASINTGKNPYEAGFTFHKYRVSASEAVPE